MGKTIHVIGGGTFSHVRNHLAIAAPAFGSTARDLYGRFYRHYLEEGPMKPRRDDHRVYADSRVKLHLTKMAAPRQSNMVTNEDVAALIDTLVADPETRVIIMNAALCDYHGSILEDTGLGSTWHADVAPTPSGSHAPRLKTAKGNQEMLLTPADKLLNRIRKERKDIFLVAFKTTTGATPDEQYLAGLNLLKANSCNLVLANDTVTRNNMVIVPEESRYFESTDRDDTLAGLVKIVLARIDNTFTRSTVVDGDTIPWQSDLVPENLRTVVNHCIEQGAYKPFRGSTAGHFAVKIDDGTILTTKRKRDFNNLSEVGMVKLEYEGDDHVIAHGAKPSVGGQSQRAIFSEHPEVDCIVHFHCPLKAEPRDFVPVAPQWQNECGSHQCGQNTSRNMSPVNYGQDNIKVVMLDQHGPNIGFSRNTAPETVIDFIEANFDLKEKTGGLVA